MDGKAVAQKRLENLKLLVHDLGLGMAIIQVGNSEQSSVYIKNKLKQAESIGISTKLLSFKDDVTFDFLASEIKWLNNDNTVHGFILQLPLPDALKPKTRDLLDLIDPIKDIDGLTTTNQGRLFVNNEATALTPATPTGVIHLLQEYNVDVLGKNIVILGASSLVGKPVAIMLQNRGATITICNSKTQDIKEFTQRADIIISATGKSHSIKADHIKYGTVVIDVGLSRLNDKLVGDVDSASVDAKALYYSPVPGGVGPMTIVTLLENVYRASLLQK